MNIHPRLACGIFGIIYGFIGVLIDQITVLKVFENIWYYVIGLIIAIVINEFFGRRYPKDDYEGSCFTDEFED